ncbi:hypothetical protein AB0O34_02325 [Sphaerisporangium sp. NPDC088356]|uniref:DUF6941 family protein n=1 Tax=Sphaerisporangium sp. NPDC088356 TaxID=3154871 RepID=UPI0034373FBB
MQAFIVLCDAAQRDTGTGKVHILGADWSVTAPSAASTAVVVFLRVPWEELAVERTFHLRLVDEAGIVVKVNDDLSIEFGGQMGSLADSGVPEGDPSRLTDIHSSIAVTVAPLPLVQGATYTWCFDVDGKGLASTTFVVRAS